MLLAADGNCRDVVQSAGLLTGFEERLPPGLGIHCRSVRVLRLAEAYELTCPGIGDAHLA